MNLQTVGTVLPFLASDCEGEMDSQDPVQERTLNVAGLLCDVNYAPAHKGSLPAVILLHQRQGRKEDLAPIAKTLANAGFLAVRWDAANHGTRIVNEDDNKHW